MRVIFPIEISICSDRLSIKIYGQKTDLKVLNIFSIKTYQIFPAGLFYEEKSFSLIIYLYACLWLLITAICMSWFHTLGKKEISRFLFFRYRKQLPTSVYHRDFFFFFVNIDWYFACQFQQSEQSRSSYVTRSPLPHSVYVGNTDIRLLVLTITVASGKTFQGCSSGNQLKETRKRLQFTNWTLRNIWRYLYCPDNKTLYLVETTC